MKNNTYKFPTFLVLTILFFSISLILFNDGTKWVVTDISDFFVIAFSHRIACVFFLLGVISCIFLYKEHKKNMK
ncbi:hypothetical protein [Streptococcus suis]|uniref:Uncharacterized protein n=1 Tax=Streptococcus suis TaxID=1307 RepID=A0A123UU97_STRSU|nr:hypothetical protein [Streptococcus suis]MCK3894703.1 hypothetical protein [Streptococcus suis]NQH27571.1 hypothetical protein [Streptococcus suis]NQH30897.1 hypothetical protein [Streptococcus suis]NQH47029.1 hypothetical protein [Streptococcus suis]NQH53379.1 hypothetical protein [Streptococcus suis]